MSKNHFRKSGYISGPNDDGISALLGVILMIILVVNLTVILSGFFLSFMAPIQRTIYLSADALYSQKSGSSLITLSHKGGDALPLSSSGPASIQIISGSGSQTAQPDPSGLVWKPGMDLYIFRTSSGYTVTNDVNRIPGATLVFPGGQTVVSIVDSTNNIIVYSKTLQIPVSVVNATVTQTSAAALQAVSAAATTVPSSTVTLTPTATVSAAPTSTVTSSPTATLSPVQTTNTTISPTATSTPTPTANATATPTATPTPTATMTGTRTITVIWSPSASGYASLSPPTKLANSAEVVVPRGSSKTIYYVPNANVSVLNIKLDGTTVYTGSSKGVTISYTVTNIVEDRTLIATFG